MPILDFKPKLASVDESWGKDLGWLLQHFEPFEPSPKHPWDRKTRPASKDDWKIVKPKTAPPVGSLPLIIENMVKMTWKFAEPPRDAARSNVVIGARGQAAPALSQTYHPQVRPVKPDITTTYPNASAIASDWGVFRQIERTNAVSFRGDSRSPHEVIVKCRGFSPPNTRTDRYYLENNVFKAFADYLKRRYTRDLSQADFLRAVDSSAPRAEDKKLLVDYMMWRSVVERESAHMGRMVSSETLKGYISTSKSIDSSINFGTRYCSTPGWVYLVVVHGGFIVPWDGTKHFWGSEEAEIAQWGPIPAERIVGFRRLTRFEPEGPVFIRRTFRKAEPKAFERMYNVMSGMTPAAK